MPMAIRDIPNSTIPTIGVMYFHLAMLFILDIIIV